MDLKRLRTFVTVAERGTVSGAAEELRITQPALSRHLQELCAELDVLLFDQVGRRLRLTAEGAELLPTCRALLAQAEALLEHARSLSEGDSGELRVGATAHSIGNLFPGFLRKFAAQYPSVRVKTLEARGIDVWDLLRRGELHAAVALRPESESEFIVHPLPVIGFVTAFVAAGSFRLGRNVEVRDLAEIPLLLLRPGFGSRKVFDAACKLEGVTPKIFLESSACDTLLSFARAGHGVAVIPTSAHIDRESLRVAPLGFRGRPLASETAVIWHRERRLPRYAEAFSTTLAAHARSVIPPLGRAE